MIMKFYQVYIIQLEIIKYQKLLKLCFKKESKQKRIKIQYKLFISL